MVPQPAAAPRPERLSAAGMLLRPRRLHRDVSLGPGARARACGAHRPEPQRPGDCRARRRSARALRGTARARARGRDERARSGCHRAGRRALEHRAPPCRRAAAVAALRLLRPGRDAPRAPRAWRFERRARRSMALGPRELFSGPLRLQCPAGDSRGEIPGMSRLIAVLAALLLSAPLALAAVEYKIVTADKRGTYFAIGGDLARLVAPAADISLEVVPTDGSAHNIRLLRHEPGVKLAIVQADVYQAFVDRAPGARDAARVIAPLRVI